MYVILKLLLVELARSVERIQEAPLRCLPVRGLVGFKEVV